MLFLVLAGMLMLISVLIEKGYIKDYIVFIAGLLFVSQILWIIFWVIAELCRRDEI